MCRATITVVALLVLLRSTKVATSPVSGSVTFDFERSFHHSRFEASRRALCVDNPMQTRIGPYLHESGANTINSSVTMVDLVAGQPALWHSAGEFLT